MKLLFNSVGKRADLTESKCLEIMLKSISDI